MANTIQLRRGNSDVVTSGGSATSANAGEPVVFLPDSGDQKFYIAKSGTAGDFVWLGAPISDTTSESSATKLMTANAIQAAITAGVEGEDTLAEMGDTDISSAASGHILVHDGSDSFDNVAVSGDATLAANGALTIANDAIESGMINDNVISGQAELASGVANTDELLISDAGTIKRVDVSVLASNSSFASGTPTAITVADESSDTTCFPLFATAATGDLGPKSGSNLTFNSSSGLLTATSFAGDLTGDVTGNAATATKLAATKTINGTAFDGSANITLGNDSVTNAMMADDAIDTAQLADGAVNTARLAADAVTAAKLADDAVVTANIVDANVTTAKIAADAITGAKIADDAINSEHYTDGSIDTAHIANDAVDGDKLANNITIAGNLTVNGTTTTVNQTNLDVSDNIIGLNRGATSNANDSGLIIERGSTGNNAAFIWDESEDEFIVGTTTAEQDDTGNLSITAADLKAATLTATTLSVTNYGLASGDIPNNAADTSGNAATATKLAATKTINGTAFDGSANITLGNDSVTNAMMADDAIDTAQLADSAVNTARLAADAVTGAKIADNAIDSEHYTDGSIDTAHIGDLQVTTAKIAADAITGAKIADDAINSEHLTDGSVDNVHLAGSIAITKLASSTISGVSLGNNLNNLTVDDATVELNSGTTFNGGAARTISAKTAAIADGGTALATADQIHTFVSGFNIDGGAI